MGADIYYLRPGQTVPEVRHYSWEAIDEEIGYFRDRYDDGSTLRVFGLTWSDDLPDFMNEKGEITAPHAEALLAELAERRHDFADNAVSLSPQEQEYHRHQAAVFKALLRKVTRNEGARLYCAL